MCNLVGTCLPLEYGDHDPGGYCVSGSQVAVEKFKASLMEYETRVWEVRLKCWSTLTKWARPHPCTPSKLKAAEVAAFLATGGKVAAPMPRATWDYMKWWQSVAGMQYDMPKWIKTRKSEAAAVVNGENWRLPSLAHPGRIRVPGDSGLGPWPQHKRPLGRSLIQKPKSNSENGFSAKLDEKNILKFISKKLLSKNIDHLHHIQNEKL